MRCNDQAVLGMHVLVGRTGLGLLLQHAPENHLQNTTGICRVIRQACSKVSAAWSDFQYHGAEVLNIQGPCAVIVEVEFDLQSCCKRAPCKDRSVSDSAS